MTDRRSFIERITVGAALATASSIPFASTLAEPGTHASGPWNEAWLDKITGKHKQFFDATSTNEGFPMAFAAGFLNLNKEAYGLSDHDLTAVVGFRHFAMPMALPDAMWQKYHIGEGFKIMDPATKAPATRNPFLHADGVPLPGTEIQTLVNRGVIFTVCNVALTVISGKFAPAAGMTADAAKAEWTAALLPGTYLVPIGVLAVNRAQEKGCTYCYAG
jgi:intracellular sulfur oxidation DsrE/DsrF family protein